MDGFLNLSVLFNFAVCMHRLLFVRVYYYVGFKSSLELVV